MAHLQIDQKRSGDIEHLFGVTFGNYEVSFAIADFNDSDNQIFGWNMDHFMYSASIPKIFIAHEVLARVLNRQLDMKRRIEIRSPNDVDADPTAFLGDTRPLLRAGDVVTVEYLLDLMLTRSDNTAANVLIDLVGRDNINLRVIRSSGWHGSELNWKYLPKDLDDPIFRSLPNRSCARHIVEFFWYLPRGPRTFIKSTLMRYMGQFNKEPVRGLWLPGKYNHYCRKGGKHSQRMQDGRTAHYLHDAGIVTGTHSNYVVALMTLDKNDQSASSFPMKEFAQTLFDYMESYKYR